MTPLFFFFTFLTSLAHDLSTVKFLEKNQCQKNFERMFLIALENVYKEKAIKFRSVKQQQSTMAERLIESGETESAEMSANKQIGDQVKSDYLKCSERFVVYQKKCT